MFDCPGFSVDGVCIGVLHCLDLGVAADALGNILWECLLHGGLQGTNRELKVQSLWHKIKQYYKDSNPPSRLGGLTELMLKKPKKAPKLKAKGAETRCLVPFGVLLAQEMFDMHKTDHFHLVLMTITALHDFYMIMSTQWDATLAAMCCRKYLTLYSRLSKEAQLHNKCAWVIKPKFHMFQEMVEFQSFELGNPKGFWEYKDEDFVGWVSHLATRRGGKNSVRVVVDKVLQRYRGLSVWSQVA